MPADSERNEDGLSRRQVLARGAVAAGVVWAAPVIRTATAYATSAAGTERPCTTFYLVCIDPLGVRPVRFPKDTHGYDGSSADIVASAVSTTTTSSTTSTSSTSTTSTSSTSTTTTTTTAPPSGKGSVIVNGSSNNNLLPNGSSSNGNANNNPDPLPDTETVPVDDLGLFPEPTLPTPAGEAAPQDPHVLAVAAAQGAEAAGTPDNIPPGIRQWMDSNPNVPVQYPVVEPMLTQSSDEGWAVLLQPVDGPDPLTHQCRGVKGYAQVKGSYAEFYLDPDPEMIDEIGRRMIFPNPRSEDLLSDPTLLIENVMFVYCCPQ